MKQFQPLIRLNSVATIQNDGLVGSKYLEVDAGTSAAESAQLGSTIPHREPVEIGDLIYRVSETVKTANQTVLDIRGRVDDTVTSILNIGQQTSAAITDITKQVNKFTTSGNAIASDVSMIVAKTRSGQGTLGQLLNDDKLYQQLRDVTTEGQRVAANFKEVSNDLKGLAGPIDGRFKGVFSLKKYELMEAAVEIPEIRPWLTSKSRVEGVLVFQFRNLGIYDFQCGFTKATISRFRLTSKLDKD